VPTGVRNSTSHIISELISGNKLSVTSQYIRLKYILKDRETRTTKETIVLITEVQNRPRGRAWKIHLYNYITDCTQKLIVYS